MKDSVRIENMIAGGKVAASILKIVLDEVVPGVTTLELDDLAESLCDANNVKPAFKGYQEFPATLCIGLNDVVVHGIPDERELKEGDLLSLDFGIVYNGVYLDMARTVGVGEISDNAKKLMTKTEESWYNALEVAKPGNTIGDIGHAIQSTIEAAGYSVVREMVGHGVGVNLHEDPMIPGYGIPGNGEKLREGQTIAIESIINEGEPDIVIGNDGWTTAAKDGMLSALFENTVLVLENPEILTNI